MLGFGRSNPFPFTLGGGESTLALLHASLLDTYAPGWDTSEEGDITVEAYAQALAVSMMWAANRRLAVQGQPLHMLDGLSAWEHITRLRPLPNARANDRRRVLAAKLRGFASNALGDIEAACAELLGSRFLGVHVTAPAIELVYWPGQNPGPPGYEWSSNRCRLRIDVTKAGLDQAAFSALMGELDRLLDGLVPSYCAVQWAVTPFEFLVGSSTLGEAVL